MWSRDEFEKVTRAFSSLPKNVIIILLFVIFVFRFLVNPDFSYTLFLYFMYSMLMVGFICYPLKLYTEYYTCMVFFFFGFVPLAFHFLYFEPRHSFLYLASSLVQQSEQLLYYLPEMFFMVSVNSFLVLATIPAFRYLVSI